MTAEATPPGAATAHLRAAAWALAIALCAGGVAWFAANMTIDHRVAGLASSAIPERSRGLAVLRTQLEQSRSIALFGSSELAFDVENRADRFFSTAPTGFNVVAIGNKAMTPLVQALAIQALGSTLGGRPLVILLSPFNPHIPGRRQEWFAGNFSRLHAAVALTNRAIPDTLRRETARQLVAYPVALRSDPVLRLAAYVESLDSPFAVMAGALLRPILFADRLWLTWVDGLLGAIDVRTHQAHATDRQAVAAPIQWTRLERTARDEYARVSRSNPFGFLDGWEPEPLGDAVPDSQFVSRLSAWPALNELATIARSAQAVGAQVLVLGIPYSGAYMDATGVSRQARLAYYDRLQAEAHALGISLVDQREHDEDRAFLHDSAAHLSPLGWLIFNRDIDDFARRIAP